MDEEFVAKLFQEEDLYAVVTAMEETIVKLEAFAVDVASKPVTHDVSKDVMKLKKISCPEFS